MRPMRLLPQMYKIKAAGTFRCLANIWESQWFNELSFLTVTRRTTPTTTAACRINGTIIKHCWGDSHDQSRVFFFKRSKIVNKWHLCQARRSSMCHTAKIRQSHGYKCQRQRVAGKTSKQAGKHTSSPPVHTGVPQPHAQTRSSLPCLP